MTGHKHRTKTISEPQPFRGSVASPQRKAAHGGYSETHTCSCGAIKTVNKNGVHAEHGRWGWPK